MEDLHHLYLNGEYYGSGDSEYMLELVRDYVVTCGMYDRKEVDFKITKEKKPT